MKKAHKKSIYNFFHFICFCTISINLLTTPLFLCPSKEHTIPLANKCIKEDVRVLTSIAPPRNYINTSSLDRIAGYIFDVFKKCDLNVFYQRYKTNGKEYKNIVAYTGGENKKRIVIGAHYDVYGNQPGADDNASGIAGLLGLARLIKKNKPDLKYRIEFVAYCLEEPPFFNTEYMGSAIHARSLAKQNIKVKLMICLDMIGYFSDVAGSQKYPTFIEKSLYPDRANFIAVMGKKGQKRIISKVIKFMKAGSHIHVLSIIPPSGKKYIGLSDQINYWKFNYNAILITDTAYYRNTNYHRETDTIDTLNFDKMAEVIKGLYWAVINL